MRLLLISLAYAASLVAHAQGVKVLVQSSPLAGFQYYAGEMRWEELKVGDPLALVREPDNRFDPRAVRVEWRGVKLGYLPRAENEAVAQALDQGLAVEGRIAALVRHKNPWRRLRIDVFVPL
ncbi:MAG: HIRAN domain-containing protein [Rhodocyclaceae bacterium]|nr:HIRAN domain-containing protein [Rhodocyclaceae bacterium]